MTYMECPECGQDLTLEDDGYWTCECWYYYRDYGPDLGDRADEAYVRYRDEKTDVA